MKNIYFTLLIILPFFSFAQCPPAGTFTLTSQAEVNAFGLNYPNCNVFDYAIIISGNDIVDLTPLAGLTEVLRLAVINNPLLFNLNGLELSKLNGNFSGFLEISNNLALQDISALASIADPASGYLVVNISNNPQLTSLNGLQGITSSSYFESVSIFNNDSLTNLIGLDGILNTLTLQVAQNDNLVNLSGLDNLEAVNDELNIDNNSSLVSFVGLENIIYSTWNVEIKNNLILSDVSQLNVSPGFGLKITNNPNLSICNTASICGYLNDSTYNFVGLTLRDNAEGCNSFFQVASACSIPPVNDESEAAIPIALNETLEIYSEFGSASIQLPSCNDSNREDVWLTFNLETSTLVDVLVDNTYNLQLWEGDVNNLTQTVNACATNSLDDISITANTNYYLQVWSNESSGAIGLFDITVQDATLSLDNDVFEGFSIFPNPVNSILTFRANDNIESIAVYNLLGQNVKSIDPKTTQGRLDVSSLTTGMYIVKVGIDNVFETFRIAKN